MTQPTAAAGEADPRHPMVTGLLAIIALETVMLVVGAALVVWGAVQTGIGPITIALLVTTVLAALGLGLLGVGLAQRRRRLLGGVLTWQVLQLGCSIIAFQGVLGPEWMGWVLFVPAVAGIVLCMSRPVVAVYGGPPKGH